MTIAQERLCKDCRFCADTRMGGDCKHPSNALVSPVNGEVTHHFTCYALRLQIVKNGCGSDGSWFEPGEYRKPATTFLRIKNFFKRTA